MDQLPKREYDGVPQCDSLFEYKHPLCVMITAVLSLTLRASAEMRFEPLAKPAEFMVGAHGHRLAFRELVQGM